MDCSWLLDDIGDDNKDSESDPEEAQNELESRLYSIVHHNDLSQPLPSELSKNYAIDCTDNGEIVVTLKSTLDEIKLQENISVNETLQNSPAITDCNDSITIDASFCEDANNEASDLNSTKRFRYSNVNIDEVNSNQTKVNEEDTELPDINDFFKITPGFFGLRHVRRYARLKLPSAGQCSNWKTDSNASFIPLESNLKNASKKDKIIHLLTLALKKVNQNVKNKTLEYFAKVIFQHKKNCDDRNRKRQMKARRLANQTVTQLSAPSEFANKTDNESQNQNRKNSEVRNTVNGSISLNISPFKPSGNSTVIDLVSEEEPAEQKNHLESVEQKMKKKLPKKHIPTKWTKEMIKFYTVPSKKKREMRLDTILNELKRTSTADDWWLDPRDEQGTYHRKPVKHSGLRCQNCRERGHFIRDCPKPKKIPTCILCGGFYHSDYTCPNRICLKCGVYLSNSGYGEECNACYYSTFEYDKPCELCLQVTHRSSNCPDIWRSFHATTGGKKKIPGKLEENKRKYCCNCAKEGHFSHRCPFVMYSGQQVSPFVINYTDSPCQAGMTELFISNEYSYIIDNNATDRFLQSLSDSTSAFIHMEEVNKNYVFQVSGTFEQCKSVTNQIESYLNTKKRKRREPLLSRKKRRIK